MKKFLTLIVCLGLGALPLFAQSPSVYCTFWNGSSEYMAYLNFNTNTVDAVGVIPGSTSFPVASANGYDSYRNRYYVLSNQGLVAIDAATGLPAATATQFAGDFKHLSYNPVTDLLYATRYNGTDEEFYQISPDSLTVVNQGILNIGTPMFVVGFYGTDAFANEVIFQTNQNTGGIKTVNMATGQITNTFTKPDYLANVLLAAHDPLTDFYYAVGLRNTRLYLIKLNKATQEVDTVGVIPGATAIALVGSTVETVHRKFIFVSNLGITCVNLDNPSATTIIPYPAGVSNVKGFQTNAFAAPIPRPAGNTIRSQFKWVENWQKDGLDLPNTAVQELTPTQPGNYRYKVRRPNGAIGYSSEIYFGPTEIQSLQNTSRPFCYLDNQNQRLMIGNFGQKEANLRIISAEGRCVRSGAISPEGLQISNLPAGIYQVQLQNGAQFHSLRFLKP